MRMLDRAAALAALTAVVAAPVAAQSWRGDFGINAGGSWYSRMLDQTVGIFDPGINDFVDIDQRVRFLPSWLVGSQLGFWFTDRFGIRANGVYAYTHMDGDGFDALDIFDREFFDNVTGTNLWTLTGDLMYRFVTPSAEFTRTEVLPYVAGGLGAKFIHPAGDNFVCGDLTDVLALDFDSCVVFAVPAIFGTEGFAMEDQTRFAGLIGLGADIRFSRRWFARLEINDRIYKPEIHRVVFEDNIFRFLSGFDNQADVVHEIGGQAGIHVAFGLRRTPPVAIVTPPVPPLPPAAPAQQPPPPPREEDITVCVVDPSAINGLRMQDAKYLVSSGDTVVEQGGRRVPLRQAIGNVPTAQNQDWYIRGTPLVLAWNDYRAEYLTYGTASVRSPESVTHLGTLNGVPVFADRDEVADVRVTIQSQATRDLATIIGIREIRERLDDIGTLYVPLRATGCAFQPLVRQQPIRKGGQ